MTRTEFRAADSFGGTVSAVILYLVLGGLALNRPALAAEGDQAKVVAHPTASSPNPAYPGNREPLIPSPFVKLPIGSIVPLGWLRHQLEMEANGMTGHLEEISKWCKFDGNAWSDRSGQGHSGWEELPYWLKGYGDLGYVLKDEAIIKNARKWIEAVLATQGEDGWFGPKGLRTSLKGRPDLWPHMVMCNVLQSFYEYAGDPRVIPFLTAYFKWLNTLPGEDFGAGYWPKIRFGDNIETIQWLYNRTGERWLLDLSKRIHDNMQDWTSGVHDWHNVNLSQAFREPAVYYQQSNDEKFLRAAGRNYDTIMEMYGQFPGGGFAGDEDCRPGYTDPRQGYETCGMVEMMHSFELLTKISGNPIWSDRCEEMAFNSFPAAVTPDWKALHYLTSPNQVQLDRLNKAPAIRNGGTMFSYSPYEVYRCCQHNVAHGWPYYAEELWLATPDQGLCASLYAASEVAATVSGGAKVKLEEETDYPFSDVVTIRVSCAQPMRFPLYLRLPRWCDAPRVEVNGKSIAFAPKPLSYLAITRSWQDKDVLTLHLPMHVSVRTWQKNNEAISVDYGPLTFSLKIGERWSRYGGTDAWPETEVFPTTPWNYGLMVDSKNPASSFHVSKKEGPLADQPFTPESVPIEIHAKAKKIAAWTLDPQGLVGKLQRSPIKSDAPVESVKLIPMGAARLRVSSFPVIGEGQGAREWAVAKRVPVSASHCFSSDSVEAMVDGIEPRNSHDQDLPRFTWWDHRGTTEWVQYDFEKPTLVSSVSVYWFDDTGRGFCRAPESWKVLAKFGSSWKPVEATSEYSAKLDAYNRTTFRPITTAGLRIEAKLQSNFSAGILEWKVGD